MLGTFETKRVLNNVIPSQNLPINEHGHCNEGSYRCLIVSRFPWKEHSAFTRPTDLMEHNYQRPCALLYKLLYLQLPGEWVHWKTAAGPDVPWPPIQDDHRPWDGSSMSLAQSLQPLGCLWCCVKIGETLAESVLRNCLGHISDRTKLKGRASTLECLWHSVKIGEKSVQSVLRNCLRHIFSTHTHRQTFSCLL